MYIVHRHRDGSYIIEEITNDEVITMRELNQPSTNTGCHLTTALPFLLLRYHYEKAETCATNWKGLIRGESRMRAHQSEYLQGNVIVSLEEQKA